MARSLSRTNFYCLALCALALLSDAQTTTGLPQFTTIDSGLYDDIKINDGSILLKLHVRSKAGLIPFSYDLFANAAVAAPGYPPVGSTANVVNAWLADTSVGSNFRYYWLSNYNPVTCPGDNQITYLFKGFAVQGADGTVHQTAEGMYYYSPQRPSCPLPSLSHSADDNSGLSFSLQTPTGEPTITDSAGNTILPWSSFTDSNGNQLSKTVVCSGTCSSNYTVTVTYTDTTGLVVMTETATYDSSVSNGYGLSPGITKDVHSWMDAANNPQSVTINYSPYTQQTKFGCVTPSDIPPTAVELPSSITTPEGNYAISYESQVAGTVTGRISKIVLPSGASLQYTYTGTGNGGNGLSCDQYGGTSATRYSVMVPVLYRTLTDTNGVAHTWKYDTTTIWSATVVTDPSGNDTVYTYYTPSTPIGGYRTRGANEIERQVYQGSRTAGTLLETVISCYNGATQPCPYGGGAFVNELDTYSTLSGMTQPSHSQAFYGVGGVLLEAKEFDFTGTLISDRLLTYGTYSNGSCSTIAPNILNRVCTDVLKDGLGAILSETNNSYDAKGNLLSSSKLVSGSTYLTSSATYNSNGTVNVTTDINGAQTTYSSYACNGNFPTSISEPLSLSRSMTWDCNGGVVTSVTDENSQVTQYSYVNSSTGLADPFYRLLSVTDPYPSTTSFTYSPTTFESAMNFNGTVSTVDSLVTNDGFGHLLLAQKRQGQGSSSFDTVAYGYDLNFRPSSLSVPCVANAGKGCPGAATTTTTYDGLSRPVQVTDGGSGYTSYNYAPAGSYNNDVLVTLGPATTVPATENTKRRQFEYDGVGRLASVCELTSTANGGGACAQSAAQTGYWTKYAYDGLSRLTGVTQNAQGTSQTRSYQYDGLNRIISETNPEWGPGTATYVYDSDSSGKCAVPYTNGDLIKRTDNAGNVSCYSYDKLHRPLSTVYSGPNATTNRYFVYDAATVNGQSMANAKLRMAEAYTAACSTCGKITDEGFGYSLRGEMADFYQSSPNSGGYYHVPLTYWANGLIKSFGQFLTEDQIGYIPDGEGRAGSVYDFTYSSTTVPSVSYYSTTGQPTGDQPTQLETSCAGATCYPISYQYDPKTLRMTQYSATLNGGTISGTLTWNPNGSLQQLVIADSFNAADAQTCKYNADDLSRLASVSCGSTWAQTFSYDPFGNITKSGSVSWMPGYSASTNHYSLAGTSYDADGNLTNDGSNKYTWDAEGKQLSTSYYGGEVYTFVYDAFGHAVEHSVNGTYSTSSVRIGDFKLSAIGQTPFYSEYPFPGGSMASEYGGATGVQLGDWLGTSRAFWSYTGGGYSQSGAHAPFGEAYSYNGGHPKDFTGQETDDGVSYYFPERKYHSWQGRWLSPDPAGLAAVSPANPQSWNRYAYVVNNPLGYTDPLGLWCVWEGDSEHPNGSHDDDELAGGVSKRDCESQGGHWDKFDTITGIKTDSDGNVSQINYSVNGKNGSYDTTGSAITLDNIDQTLRTYSVAPPAADNSDTHPGLAAFYNSKDCAHCGDTLRMANTVAREAFVATGVVLVAVPVIGETGAAIAACRPGLNTSNYGHVTVYCRAWMPGPLIGVGYDPKNGVHVNVGNSIHIPLWPK